MEEREMDIEYMRKYYKEKYGMNCGPTGPMMLAGILVFDGNIQIENGSLVTNETTNIIRNNNY